MLYNTERPMTFDSVVGQKYIVESIRAQAISNKFFGVYVFGGHFGCGKTSMARILSMAANCKHLDENGNPCLECSHCKSIMNSSVDIIELDAATNTGVDSIRELRETVHYMPLELKRKIYIIDEVHMLSKGAFNALLKVLEEPPAYVTFILCTTEVDAIPSTIRSRGACYFFEQLTVEELIGHVENVAERNGITLLPDASNVIARYSQGAARNALSILDQASSISTEVSAEIVQRLLGVSDNAVLFDFAKEILLANTIKAVSLVEEFSALGKDFTLLCSDLIDIVTDTLLYTIGGKKVVQNTEVYVSRVEELAAITSADNLCIFAEHLHSLKKELRMVPGKSTLLAAIIRLTMDTNNSIIALTNRINDLEKEIVQLKAVGISYVKPEESINTDITDMVADELLGKVADEELKVEFVEESEDEQVDESYSEAALETEVACNVSTESVVMESGSIENVDETVDVHTQTLTGNFIEQYAFDPFDLFGVFENEKHLPPTVPNEVKKESVKMEIPQEIKEASMLVERISMENAIFATALKGCQISEREDGVYIETTLETLKTVVRLYLSVYKRKGCSALHKVVV